MSFSLPIQPTESEGVMPPMQYVVCGRILDAETNEHCEYDGEQRMGTNDNRWRCPACGARRPF